MDIYLAARARTEADAENRPGRNGRFRVQRRRAAGTEEQQRDRDHKLCAAREEHHAHDEGERPAALLLRRGRPARKAGRRW